MRRDREADEMGEWQAATIAVAAAVIVAAIALVLIDQDAVSELADWLAIHDLKLDSEPRR